MEKIQSGQLEFRELTLDSLIDSDRDQPPYADQFGVVFELENELPGARVRADPHRLAQVLTNLLSNAVKFSPQGETVCVVVRREMDRVRVQVMDRGPGIPEEFRSRIFGRFQQADASDARQKGGPASASPSPGWSSRSCRGRSGSNCWVFPARESGKLLRQGVFVRRRSGRRRPGVRSASRAPGRHDARNGRHRDFAALRELDGMAQVPIVFMTAKVQPKEVAVYREMGAADVIAKPFDPMTLASELRSIYARMG